MEAAETHLVTGGSGFIAQHLVNELLSQGIRVNATVRSLRNAKKVASLKGLQEKHSGRLQLFEADLLKPGSFKEAMQGCSVVHHVASPFMMAEMIKDGQKECVEPALEGTRNVLASVKETTSVKRVVLTSTSMSAHSTFLRRKQRRFGKNRLLTSKLCLQSGPYLGTTRTSTTRWEARYPKSTSTRPAP